jgi:hypothetical protein
MFQMLGRTGSMRRSRQATHRHTIATSGKLKLVSMMPAVRRSSVPRLTSGIYLEVMNPRNAQRRRTLNATNRMAVAAAQPRSKTGRGL